MAQVIQCLPSKCEARSSNPSTSLPLKKKEMGLEIIDYFENINLIYI
jgi:hypothetical protein